MPFYVVFHNLKSQNAGLVDVKKDLNSKRSNGNFVRKHLKISTGSEVTLTHKAKRPSNYFFQLFHTFSG